jgi:glucose-6-phosphate isomerase
MTARDRWNRYGRMRCEVPELGLVLDPSCMGLDDHFMRRLAAPLDAALKAMAALEAGAEANPDEKRMVGHYWLRDPSLAPTPALRQEIVATVEAVKAFAARVHDGQVAPGPRGAFRRLLNVGIGGSALGPMFVADALGSPSQDRLAADFLDNTDPDGFARTFARLGPHLGETLVIVTSKSGGTPETRNGMLAAAQACREAGLDFARHAVAVTQEGSALDRLAVQEGWLARFPMWDWVGGRTSVLSAVGLLPAALQGIDVDGLLAGAAIMDRATRAVDPAANPAALLALCWFHATGGVGDKAMVVLPYKDRLVLFSRYLQQLVMESLGKRLDLMGHRVDQGLTVYGNKGSTDQHAYLQQLRDGVPDFFATFVRVLEDGGAPLEVDPGVTAGDYLHGFLLGTRTALLENGRESITLTIPRVDARSVGALIALFERAVGLYAGLIGVNAYHQPGVEAGKKAAAGLLALQAKVLAALGPTPRDAEALAAAAGAPAEAEAVLLLCEHLAANGRARQEGSGVAARFGSAA